MVALLDRFKKKPAQAAAKAERTLAASAPAEREGAVASRPGRERSVLGVITAPHMTEKSSAGRAGGWYTFRVEENANKIIVRRAVEDRYGVTVKRVRIVNQSARKMRLGRIAGQVPGFKKAMVKVGSGQSIEFT
ncbi:MAG: 50S ribosomal protein L23 [Patescibacteria group bacterium]